MSFNVGDRVVCVNSRATRLQQGQVYTVYEVDDNLLAVEGIEDTMFWCTLFILAPKTEPHIHCEVIKAWADGATVQRRNPSHRQGWRDSKYPNFSPNWQYRVKPDDEEEISSIRKEMDKLSARLKELE